MSSNLFLSTASQGRLTYDFDSSTISLANNNIDAINLDITGNVATATLTETGFAGQMDFVDYFHLINDGDSWKIISKNFTTK